MHSFYFIFVHVRRFSVLDLGLALSGSEQARIQDWSEGGSRIGQKGGGAAEVRIAPLKSANYMRLESGAICTV